MPVEDTSVLGWVTLEGPQDGQRDQAPLWTLADLRVAYHPPVAGGSRKLVDHNFGLRTMLYDARSSRVTVDDRWHNGTLGNAALPFQAPQLLRVLCRTHSSKGPGPRTRFHLLGRTTAPYSFDVPDVADADASWQTLLATPRDSWPAAGWLEEENAKEPLIRVPRLLLAGSAVRLSLLVNASNILSLTPTGILGLSRTSSAALDVQLSPDGLEFDAHLPPSIQKLASLGGTAAGVGPLTATFRIEAHGGEWVLRLLRILDEAVNTQVRAGLHRLLSAPRAQRSPLRIDVDRRGLTPPLFWQIHHDLNVHRWTIPDLATTVSIDTSVWRLRLETDVPANAEGTADAELTPDTAKLVFSAANVSLHAGPRHTPTAVTSLQWTFANQQQWDWAAPGLELDVRLPTLLEAPEAPETSQKEDGTHSSWFLAIERGWIQWPRLQERPVDPTPQPSAARHGALKGLVVLRRADRTLEFDAADTLSLKATWDISGPTLRSLELRLANPRGTARGFLFRALESPTGAEALPTLLAGPGATEDVALRFGLESHRARFGKLAWENPASISLDPPGPDHPVLAWLADPVLPLIAAASMLRTVPSGEPQRSRALFPHVMEFGDTATQPRLTLKGDGIAALDPATPMRWHPDWPWGSQTSVSANAVLPTLPDVELFPNDVSSTLASPDRMTLRYDLPMLDEYFAGVRVPLADPSSFYGSPTTGPDRTSSQPVTALQLTDLIRHWSDVAESLSLTKTQARVAIDSAARSAAAANYSLRGLFEPGGWNLTYSWLDSPNLTLPPVGGYALDGQPYFGSSALAGLSLPAATPDGLPPALTGFAPDVVVSDSTARDNRGYEQSRNPSSNDTWTWRDAEHHGSDSTLAFKLATLQIATPLQLGTRTLRFWCRDLPLDRSADGSFSFDGATNPIERAPGPDGTALTAAAFPRCLFAWRLFDPERADYAFPLGPFVFRPLRLWSIATSQDKSDPGSLTSLSVIGSLCLDAGLLADRLGPDPENESGNLVQLTFSREENSLRLRTVERVQVTSTPEAPLAFRRSDAPLVLYFSQIPLSTPGAASPQNVPLRLSLTLADIPNVSGSLAFGLVRIETILFGQHAIWSGTPAEGPPIGTFILTPNLPSTLSAGLWTQSVELSLGGQSANLTVKQTLVVGSNLPQPSIQGSLLSWTVGSGTAHWLGATLNLPVPPGSSYVDSGFVLRINGATLEQGTALIRNLPCPADARAYGFLAAAPQANASTPDWTHYTLPSLVGQLDLLSPDKVHIATQTFDIEGTELESTLLVSLQCRDASTIRWPEAPTLTTPPPQPNGPHAQVTQPADATPRQHSVTFATERCELPLDLLERENAAVVLARPWHLRVGALHTFPSETNTAREWHGVEHITITDHDRLVSESQTVSTPVTKDSEFAFSPRYRSLSYRNETAAIQAKRMAHPGVAQRALASAGLPDETVLKALQEWSSRDDNPTDSGWVIFGGGVSLLYSVATPGKAIPLSLPWILWTTTPSQTPSPLRELRQCHERDARAYRVSATDLHLGSQPALLPDYSPRTLSPAPNAARFESNIRTLFEGDRDSFGEIRYYVPAEQPFVEPVDARPSAVDTLREMPVFIHSLLALQHLNASSRVLSLIPAPHTESPSRSTRHRAPAQIARVQSSPDSLVDVPHHQVREIFVLGVPRKDWRGASQPVRTCIPDSGAAARQLALAAHDSLPGAHLIVTARIDRTNPWLTRSGELRYPLRLADGTLFTTITPLADRLEGVVDNRPVPFSDTLFPSQALDWPLPPCDRPPGFSLKEWTLSVRGNRAFQTAKAVAGRQLALSTPALTPRGLPLDKWSSVHYLLSHQQVAFDRTALMTLPAVPARHLAALGPRLRTPTMSEWSAAIQPPAPSGTLTGEATFSPTVAPILPGAFEQMVVGLRPGVLYTTVNTWVGGSQASWEPRDLDPRHPRFGAPADAMPLVAMQTRAPRSTALEKAERRLSHRRRTFVALDVPSPGAPAHLAHAVILRGAASLFRLGDGEHAVRVELVNEEVPAKRISELNDSSAVVTIRLLASTGINLANLLKEHGLPPEVMSVELAVGSEARAISRPSVSSIGDAAEAVYLRFDLDSEQRTAWRGLLSRATANTAPRLTLNSTAPSGFIKCPSLRIPLVLAVNARSRPTYHPVNAVCIFGDPSLDRMLSTRTVFASNADQTFRLACDRPEYNPGSSLYLACGAFDRMSGAFTSGASAAVPLTLTVQRLAEDGKVRTLAATLSGGIASPPGGQGPHTVESGSAYEIPLGKVVLEQADLPGFRLLPADILSIAVTPDARSEPIEVRVRIVREPVLPTPPAVYSLVVQASPDRLTVPLHATAPMPQLIEHPDLLRDLAGGAVRRRGLFVWPFAVEAEVRHERFGALIKIDRSGGGQMIDGIEDLMPLQ